MPSATSPQSSLAGEWALVTGASSGIGAAMAEGFAQEGAKLILAARREDRLQKVATACRELGSPSVVVVASDLSNKEGVEALAARVLEVTAQDGGLFVLVNNSARGAAVNTALQVDPDDGENMMFLNLLAPMRLVRRLAPSMVEAKRGVVVNITSAVTFQEYPGIGVYAASKWGLRGYSRNLYKELRPHNVKVVSIAPAFVATEMTEEFPPGADRSRMMRPDDVVQAALLAVRLSPCGTPEEIVLRNVLPVTDWDL